jgi:DNA-binding HxlR family transcriptional regulator
MLQAREAEMVKRKSHRRARCPVARPLDAIGDWWSLLIVRDAFEGLNRFNEFQRNLGLAKNILSARLKNLVAHGIFEIVPAPEAGRHEYRLTTKGKGLFPVVVALRQWGEDFFFDPAESHVQLVDRKDGFPVRRIAVQSHDGRIVGPEETFVRAPIKSKAVARAH